MTPDTWQDKLTKEVRANTAKFLRKAVQPGGFLADTQFKEHAEAGKLFIIHLEEADRPYLQIDYFEFGDWGAKVNQLAAAAYIPYGQTEPRWTLNAHYETIYREGIPWETFLGGDISHNVLRVWASETTSFKRRLGNKKDSWLFPHGLSSQWSVNTDVLHASNY